MIRRWQACVIVVLALAGACARRLTTPPEAAPNAFGAAVVLVSGDKQADRGGAQLDQPIIVRVNDAEGAAVAGALVRFTAAGGTIVHPDHGLTGAGGQFSIKVDLGSMTGQYQIVASTATAAGKRAEIRIPEIALGYQELLGQQLSAVHCIRCHDPESTSERVSNHDNLNAQAHQFTNGAVMNSLSDANLTTIIRHGGAALNKSAEMPPYENRLTKAEIDALVAYIRAVADPPYRPQGVFYASN